MTLLYHILNNNLDNDLALYFVFFWISGAVTYSFTKNILSKSYVEKGVQTDVTQNYSNSSSQTIQDNETSIGTLSRVSSSSSIETLSPVSSSSSTETLSPVSSTFQDTSSLIPTVSEVVSPTIVGEVIPNQDIVGRVVDNAEYIAAKVEQLNALDPFSATPWTPERVNAMIDTLGMVSNLFN